MINIICGVDSLGVPLLLHVRILRGHGCLIADGPLGPYLWRVGLGVHQPKVIQDNLRHDVPGWNDVPGVLILPEKLPESAPAVKIDRGVDAWTTPSIPASSLARQHIVVSLQICVPVSRLWS